MTTFARRAALTLVLVLATAGCGVRLATPAPTEPSPGPVEQVRARTVDDALALASTASALSATGPADPLATVLTDVTAQSTAHAQALGGVYSSGLPASTAGATATPTSAPVPTAEELLLSLATTARTAGADTDSLTDANLARLVGSVATARTELAIRLAAALGTAVPTPDPSATDPSGAASSGAASMSSASPSTASAATPTPSPTVPTSALTALVLAHDQAGYAFEVIAARRDADQRAGTLAAARTQRAAAETWAQTAGVSGTKLDPRRAQYALPSGLEQADVAATTAIDLQTAIAQAYGAAIAAAPAGGRAGLLAGLTTATAAARDWGGSPVTFPGMADPAPTATATP
ncbi:MAG: DUF4439 domain-containing protein [Actinobacteria bacterium]|nr:DUF4439 domain-containing protein [Actinomycetota bacterium]MCG2799963.1 DUF4439 domain-containing protein [Cellulomonas sp.]